MIVDGRAFFKLTTPKGTCQCLRPKSLNNFLRGLSGLTVGSIRDDTTHRIKAFSPLPVDLIDGTLVTVDGIKYRILRIGVSITPYGAELNVIRDIFTTPQAPP